MSIYKNKFDNDLYISRALLNLHGFFLVDSNFNIIENPKIIFSALVADELYLLSYIELLPFAERCIVYEELVKNNVIEVFGLKDTTINLEYSPAGVIETIAEAILQFTYDYLVNENNIKYENAIEKLGYFDNMQAVVSFYLNIPYTEVIKLPVNDIYKKYALCASAFPGQVQPLQRKEDIENGSQ